MTYTMCGLGLVLLAVVLSSSQARRQGCGFQRCLGILQRPATCSSSREFTKCAMKGALQNPACMENTREEAQSLLQNAAEFLQENCPRGNALYLCDHQMCLDQLAGPGRTCRSVEEGLQCAEQQVLQNPDCSTSVQAQTRAHLQQAHQFLELQCHGPALPTQPSVLAATEPPVLPPVTQQPQHAVEALMANTESPIVESTVCEYYRCIDMMVNQQATCSTMRQVRLCAENYIFRSIACPRQLKNNIRSMIQQEEQFLRCPTANSAYPPVTAAPAPCHYRQCFSLLQTYEPPCGMVVEGVECSRRLTHNPGCSNSIKMAAQSYVVQGEFYLRDQCEELFLYGKK